ncbi:MAG: DUF5615 family PIN-like protein [Bacteroidota bacterium]|nr:DUF5615 family PIN-like protein [Bacteroidota bacterium]MDP4286527.1 DUF5615 family PIN-like protein [Bacteroidota bacterium]
MLLREAGFDVIRIQEIAPATEDPDVLSTAVAQQRILLTFDRDFGELIFHKKLTPPPAVLHFRFDPSRYFSRFCMSLKSKVITPLSRGGAFGSVH